MKDGTSSSIGGPLNGEVGGRAVIGKGIQKLCVVPDRSDGLFDGTVSQQEAYDLGWWSLDECPLAEIIILADDDKAIRGRMPPYPIVICSLHVDVAYMQ